MAGGVRMDASEFKDVFAAEAHDYLQALNEDLLTLETNPNDRNALDEMFRAAHSLKGMSSTMGYQALADFTHQMENVLDSLRGGKLVVTENVVNTLFTALDSLELLLERTLNEQELPDLSSVLRQLQQLMEQKTSQVKPEELTGIPDTVEQGQVSIDLDEFDQETIIQAVNAGYSAYQIAVRLRPKTLLKSVRVYTVFQALEKVSTIIKCNPSAQDLEEENFDLDFTLVIVTRETHEQIINIMNSISELEQVTVTPIMSEKNELTVPSEVEAAAASELANATVAISETVDDHEKHVDAITNMHTRGAYADKFIRVETERLDKLINLVGELVISKTQVMEIESDQISDTAKNALVQLDRISTELQYAAMQLRMVPIKHVFDRFPRLVRDLSQAYNKDISLEITGEETELDRSLVNQIGDPLVHLIRNSIDHGIETKEERERLGKPTKATLRLSAYHEGGHVIIQVYDDGRGIDVDKIKKVAIKRGILPPNYAHDLTMDQAIDLIFQPGFSTNESVTDISGRGVGMDVVKNVVESLNGHIVVESTSGEGTCITIKLPLTLAIIKALLIACAGQIYALPIQSVRENLLVSQDQIKTVAGQKVIVLRNEVVPLIDLADFLGFSHPGHGNTLSVIIVESHGEKTGFIVDDIVGQQEIVIKSLTDVLGEVRGISGATVLGNGEVALIIDHNTLTKGRSESVG